MALPPPPLVPLDEAALREEAHLLLEAQRGFTRRRLLKATGVGGAIALFSGWVFSTFWRLGVPGPGRQCLSEEEAQVADAVGEAFFPGKPLTPFSAAEVQLTDFVDTHLAGMYEDNQRLFKVLFRALNLLAVFSYRTRYVNLPLADRQEVLERWRLSSLAARRAGYQSLRLVFGLGFLEDVRVRRALGLRFGCDLSARFPELSVDGAG
jgi:hypothetical protein